MKSLGISIFTFILIYFGLSSDSDAALAKQSEIESIATELISRDDITLELLLSYGLIQVIRENVYVISPEYTNGRPHIHKYDHELESANLLAKEMNQPVLLLDDLFGTHGIVGIDAVLFDSLGIPVRNVSIKTTTLKSKTLANRFQKCSVHQ